MGKPKESARKGLSYAVSVVPEDVELLRAWSHESGVPQVEIIGRLIRWFVRADEPLRRVALSLHTKGMEDDYAEALEAVAARLRTAAAAPLKGVLNDLTVKPKR